MTLLLLISLMLMPASLCAQRTKEISSHTGDPFLNLEEITLVTDRDIYIAGEELFYSVTQAGRLSQTPGTMSRVVYVDLLDSQKSPVIQAKTGTDGIAGAGMIRIPDTLRTGNYFIRAFTSLMKNYPQELFAYRVISVINPFRSLSLINIPPSDHMADSVVFYPGTGSLVSGLRNRMGIRCFNADGEPVITRGIVLTSTGDTLASFSTDRYGTALISLTPPDNGRLSLLTTDERGAGRRFEMPVVLDQGITFTAGPGQRNGELILRIMTTNGYPDNMLRVICAPLCSEPVVKDIYPGDNPQVVFEAGTIPGGLARITVSDIRGRELASRWYYNRLLPPVSTDIQITSPEMPVRSRAAVSVSLKDEAGNPLEGIISLSVTKSVLADNSRYRELAGNLQFPSIQAFRTEMAQPDINDFLIFCEEDTKITGLEGGTTDILYLPEPDGHILSGVIRDLETGEPLAGEEITLSVVGKTAQTVFGRSDGNGKFNIPLREYGRKEIVIQPLTPAEGEYYVDINDPFLFVTELDHVPGSYYPDTSRLKELNDAIISMQVSKVYDPFVRKGKVRLLSSREGNFYGEPDRTVILSDYIRLTTVREVFKELVPELTISGRNGDLALALTHRDPGVVMGGSPMVILDGIPVYDLEKVLDIPSSRIEKVEVLSARYFTGDITLNGIISIVSHKGNLEVLDFDRSIFRREYEMPAGSYDFFTPDYSVDSLKMSRIPDYRNTLYWDPAVRTGEDGTATIEFWTSDESGVYSVTAWCLTSDGRRGRNTVRFEVKR